MTKELNSDEAIAALIATTEDIRKKVASQQRLIETLIIVISSEKSLLSDDLVFCLQQMQDHYQDETADLFLRIIAERKDGTLLRQAHKIAPHLRLVQDDDAD